MKRVIEIVIGPMVALAAMEAKFALVPFACYFHWQAALHATTIAALLTVLATSYLSRQARAAATPQQQNEAALVEHRDYFLAGLSLGVNALAALFLLLMEMANIIFDPCN
ncbi:MAG: hypothetical protein IT168_23710 [Bryobacterales bacterium]|nr:hypothetical protein [Bryobacterales bacterium]